MVRKNINLYRKQVDHKNINQLSAQLWISQKYDRYESQVREAMQTLWVLTKSFYVSKISPDRKVETSFNLIAR